MLTHLEMRMLKALACFVGVTEGGAARVSEPCVCVCLCVAGCVCGGKVGKYG